MLSNNARKPFLEIARETHISGAAIHQRIQKLTAAGVILGFRTEIDPATVGYQTCAYIGYILNDPSKYNEVVERLREIPEVVDCHFTTGTYDIFAKIYARNNAHLLEIEIYIPQIKIIPPEVAEIIDRAIANKERLDNKKGRTIQTPIRLPNAIIYPEGGTPGAKDAEYTDPSRYPYLLHYRNHPILLYIPTPPGDRPDHQ